MLTALKKPGLKYTGIDIAKGMTIEATKKHKLLSIIQADAQNLCFLPDSFDIVFSTGNISLVQGIWIKPLKKYSMY